MKSKYKIALSLLLALAGVVWFVLYLKNTSFVVLEPQGLIAEKERNLLVTATLLMLIVVIPVFLLTFYVTWKYRAKNKDAEYTPDWDYNFSLEALWWGFPCLIIVALSIITWISTHELDPFKPLDSPTKPLRIQVVALQWKWLFVYPEQQIATVNFFQIPTDTPINFEITADAPMNSFWVPKLGGQIYAMPGMRSKLHLIANSTGSFDGVSANLSGAGFSGMKFIAKASSQEDFEQWVKEIKETQKPLTLNAYNTLAKPSENDPVSLYTLQKRDLFDWIIMKYMMPMPKTSNQE